MNSQIVYIINELKEIQQILENTTKTGSIPSIELDILKNKLQKIYSTLIQLSSDVNKEPEIRKDEMTPVKDFRQKVEGNKISGRNKRTEAGSQDLMQLDDQETKSDIEDKTNVSDTEAKPKEELPHKQDIHKGKKILAEKYGKNQKYINELLAQGYLKQDITSLMQSKPIKDIEVAIGINEKFLFMQELFSNDEDTYLKTIRILNDSQNFNEAFNYIHTTFNWNLESEAAQKLLDLVRRRFIVEED